MMKEEVCIFWFRRDLRLQDNAGLYRALSKYKRVVPLFIFDSEILDKLPSRDTRVLFIWQEVQKMKEDLRKMGSDIEVHYGKPVEIHRQLLEKYKITAILANRDYEPYAKERDKAIFKLYQQHDIPFKAYKDQVIFDRQEVVKDDGKAYTVYTPYMRKWKSTLQESDLASYDISSVKGHFATFKSAEIPSLEEMGFERFEFKYSSRKIDKNIIRNYHKTRDIPGIQGTSRLSMHLRFGTISIRELMRVARAENEKYFNELIWRDFYQAVLDHFPHSAEKSFRPEYDAIPWENNEAHFAAWCAGKTGYPLVDAGMRELNATGFMHNRVRMLVASFLTKHLLIDWRWGETYFAEKLLDFELASNVGGWQWAAGSGVDAAPYFRVFNPQLQLEKFDKDLKYVKKWVPEYGTKHYPKPIVEHKAARERAIATYKAALSN